MIFFCSTFGPRWKPVNTDEDAEEETKHPNILKNKEDLDETTKSEEGVNLNNMTTVTWTTDEKQEDLKKEEVKDEKIVKDEKETEKSEESGKSESVVISRMKSTDTTPRDSDVTVLGLVDKDSYTACPLHYTWPIIFDS